MTVIRSQPTTKRMHAQSRRAVAVIASLRNLAVPAVSLTLLVFGIVHVLTSARSVPAIDPPATPPRSPFGATIAAAGVVEPQSENVRVGAPLSGVILSAYVTPDDTGKSVKKGDLLFQVDDRHLRAQLLHAEARLLVPKAQLARLESQPRSEEVTPKRFRVEALRAEAIRARDDFERLLRLAGSQTISESEMVVSRQALQVADAERDRAQAELDLLTSGAWDADKEVTRAEISQIVGEIERIKTEIARSTVAAPIDGVMLQVNVRTGEFVATPPTKDLIVLGDMRRPRVRVEIDESDIPRFRSGMVAAAFVRGSDGQPMPLQFVRTEPFVVPKTSLTGNNDERVDTRVLQVLYEIEGENPSIFVGQQIDVFLNATTVPQDTASQDTASERE